MWRAFKLGSYLVSLSINAALKKLDVFQLSFERHNYLYINLSPSQFTRIYLVANFEMYLKIIMIKIVDREIKDDNNGDGR